MVASAITLIMQSTVVCTLVHMTEKGSTIDPEGFKNTKSSILQGVSLKRNKSMERLPCNKYLFFFFVYIFFKDLLDGALDVCDTYYMGRET